MVSFVKDAQAAGTDLTIEVVDANLSVADATVAQKLSIAAGDPVYEYTRLFRSKGHVYGPHHCGGRVVSENNFVRRFPESECVA